MTANAYTSYLKARLEERMNANPRYSLRAFARDLKVSPSKLSEMLSGKQGLSEERARLIAARLGLSPEETRHFCSLVLAADARSKKARFEAQAALREQMATAGYRQLQEDTFRIISDWYHFAILELLLVQGFKGDPLWIADQLDIPKTTAEAAIERLERLELIERGPDGSLRSTGVQLTTTNGIPSESIRKFNRQILEKALGAITFQDVNERDLGTLTVALHTDDLADLKELIRKQRRELNRLINERNKSRKPNAVYCFASQFFRLTKRGVTKS